MRQSLSRRTRVGIGSGCAIVAALAGGQVQSVQAATLRVPSEHSKIAAALDASVSGDTVLVAPGAYSDAVVVNFNGADFTCLGLLKDGVVLASEDGPETTVLDMSAVAIVGSGVYIAGFDLDTVGAVVEGFSFLNPPANVVGVTIAFSYGGEVKVNECRFVGFDVESVPGSGAALRISYSEVWVDGCTFSDCVAFDGGGIWAFESSLYLDGCTFTGCRATRWGGGINIRGITFLAGHRFEVRDSRFIENEALSGSGAIQKSGDSHLNPIIDECWFEGNLGSGSGAIGFFGIERKTVSNCMFLRNEADNGTGALVMTDGYNDVIGNTFVNNAKNPIDVSGSALSLGLGHSTVIDNVFSGNSGRPAIAVLPQSVIDEMGCNVFWDNPDGHVSGFELGPTDLVADPQFCDPENDDFSVSASSPCVPGGNGSCDLIGAFGIGCGSVSVESMSWGRIKGLYR